MKEEEFDQEEAERIAKIAQLAEERAAKRAAERQQAAQTQQLTSESTTTSTTDSNIIVVEKQDHTSNGIVDKSANLKNFPTKLNNTTAATATSATIQVAFRSKAQREKDAIAKLEQKRLEV
jgi:hypothetical protein